ncbi:MAG TPA: hypothetical protein DCQ84_07840, partial [Candidatus Competibacteraceae bacterium]|nr:hypothetical protein [Candidatus Competibacteraceae bacterium]
PPPPPPPPLLEYPNHDSESLVLPETLSPDSTDSEAQATTTEFPGAQPPRESDGQPSPELEPASETAFDAPPAPQAETSEPSETLSSEDVDPAFIAQPHAPIEAEVSEPTAVEPAEDGQRAASAEHSAEALAELASDSDTPAVTDDQTPFEGQQAALAERAEGESEPDHPNRDHPASAETSETESDDKPERKPDA